VNEDVGGLVDVDDSSGPQPAAPLADLGEERARGRGEIGELVACPKQLRVALEEEGGAEEGDALVVHRGVGDRAAEREPERGGAVLDLGPENPRIVGDGHPVLQGDLLLRFGHRRLVPHLGDFSLHERVDEGRLSDVRDSDHHRAHRLAGAARVERELGAELRDPGPRLDLAIHPGGDDRNPLPGEIAEP
jgi:hypothetical protein